MRVIACKQGSTEWHRARLGIPTASCFDRIITPKKLEPASGAEGYMHELLAEWLLNEPLSLHEDGGGFLGRGRDLEVWAVAHYELHYEKTEEVGFCLADDGRAGCSPDRLVGADGGLEIKCPGAKEHVANLLRMTSDYRLQVQGCLWITGRKWWDLMSYNPNMPPAIVRFEPEPAVQEALAEHVPAFCDRLERAKKALLARGCEPEKRPTVRNAEEYPF